MSTEPARPTNNFWTEVESFVDTLFEGQEGFVYVPTKNPATGHWQPYFYQYPEQRQEITSHVMDATKTKEVYIAPSLFKNPKATQDNWKGTKFLWTEFDGNAPSVAPDGIPQPSMRIQSSTDGHEHWYWRLENFETDKNVIEQFNKRLTYALDADKSAWDPNQVLRPPGTRHHDSKRRARLLRHQSGAFSITDFADLAVSVPEEIAVNVKISELPQIQEVISKYKWKTDAWDLFKKDKQPTGSRSAAMMRMAFHCVEMGMTDAEAYAVLLNCDDRWGKYKTRQPESRAKVLQDQISKARQKKAIQAEQRLSDMWQVLGPQSLAAQDIKFSWVYKDIITHRGLGLLHADPGTGKSSFSMQMGMDIALNKNFLGWESGLEHGMNTGFFSYEMETLQLKMFWNSMQGQYSEAEKTILEQRFKFIPLGYEIPLDREENQEKFLDVVHNHKLEFLIIDSLKAVSGTDENRSNAFFKFVNETLRGKLGCTVWLVHHNRKRQASSDSNGDQHLSDIYGDVFITAHLTAAIGLRATTSTNKRIEVVNTKNRLAPMFDKFYIERGDHMKFEKKVKEEKKDDKPDHTGLGAIERFGV